MRSPRRWPRLSTRIAPRRQTIDLGGKIKAVEKECNVFGGAGARERGGAGTTEILGEEDHARGVDSEHDDF